MSDTQTITAPAKEWIAALTRLTPAMAGKKPVPILHGIRISPASGTIAGYNYETSATTVLAGSEGEGYDFLGSWRWLLDAIRTRTSRDKSAPVTVSLDGDKLTVAACGYEASVEAMPIADYPSVPSPEPEVSVSIPATELRAALRRVNIAASKDDYLPILACARVSMKDGEVELYTTDRYRLAYDSFTGDGEGEAKFLLSGKVIKSVDRFLTGDVIFGIHDNRIVISTEKVTYTTIATDGDYPKIESLFPRELKASFEVDRVVLLEGARVASAMSERNNPCFVSLREAGAEVTYSFGLFGESKSPTAGVQFAEGDLEPSKFAMTPRYLIETLEQIPTSHVRISYVSQTKPLLFTPEGVAASEDRISKHLIMPVRMPS